MKILIVALINTIVKSTSGAYFEKSQPEACSVLCQKTLQACSSTICEYAHFISASYD